ncbi:MAG: winged helix-turn-helix domain-containing protein [archaeon]
MSKRTSLQVRIDILQALNDGKPHSYGSIERKANTNWETVRTHIKELKIYNAIEETPQGYQITPQGRTILKNLKKEQSKPTKESTQTSNRQLVGDI